MVIEGAVGLKCSSKTILLSQKKDESACHVKRETENKFMLQIEGLGVALKT